MHVQAARHRVRNSFTATWVRMGQAVYLDDTPAERLSDIPVDFWAGAEWNHPDTYISATPFDDEELYLFDVLSNANDFFNRIQSSRKSLLDLTFHFYRFGTIRIRNLYAGFKGNSILTGTGTFAISAVPIPPGFLFLDRRSCYSGLPAGEDGQLDKLAQTWLNAVIRLNLALDGNYPDRLRIIATSIR